MTRGTNQMTADTGEDSPLSKDDRTATPAVSRNTLLRQPTPRASLGESVQQRTAQRQQTSHDHATARQQATRGPQACQGGPIKQHAAGSLHTSRDPSSGQQHAGSDRLSSQRHPDQFPRRTFAHSTGAFRGPPFPPRVTPSLPAPDTSQKRLRLIKITDSQISASTLQTKLLRIKETKYVASYNWIKNSNSTILVPGKPPKWLPPIKKQQLREDNGQYYRDLNAARYPQYPMEPAVHSIYELNHDFNTSKIDVLGCGNTFGSLLSFARNEERTFRLAVERIGETIFLVRKTNTQKELIDDVRGYGHSFPEAYTVLEPGVQGSISHQRIISYDFAGLQCMIRTECDGYLSDKSSAIDSISHKNGDNKNNIKITSSDDINSERAQSLTTTLSSLTIAHQSDKLILRKAGNSIHQRAIFDLKTRSIKRKGNIDMSEFLPRLWANQTPNFILAWHRSGNFDEIEIKDVRDDISNWEIANTKALAKFRSILKELIEFSKNQSHFEVRRTGTGDLELWSEVKGWSALPSELKARWKSGSCGQGMAHQS